MDEQTSEFYAQVPVARPPARLIPCDELRKLYQSDPAAYRARLAALSDSDLAWQAAIYAAYHSLVTGKNITTEETLTRFQRSVDLHRATAIPADDVCRTLFEYSLANAPALVAFLRGHTAVHREHLAWRFANWLRRHHSITREPAHIARGWSALLVGASASGVA